MNGIYSKSEFYKRASMGLCGNTQMMWNSIESYWPNRNKYPVVCVRRTVFSDLRCTPEATPLEALHICSTMTEGSYIIGDVPVNNDRLTGLQGELTWLDGKWCLYYTHDLGYMRLRLQQSGKHAHGWQAIRLIKGHSTASEFRELMELFDAYTDDKTFPTIEFACMTRPRGRLMRNMVIWEIRNGY